MIIFYFFQVRRLTSAFPLLIVGAAAFHLAFMAPADKLRRKFANFAITREKKDN